MDICTQWGNAPAVITAGDIVRRTHVADITCISRQKERKNNKPSLSSLAGSTRHPRCDRILHGIKLQERRQSRERSRCNEPISFSRYSRIALRGHGENFATFPDARSLDIVPAAEFSFSAISLYRCSPPQHFPSRLPLRGNRESGHKTRDRETIFSPEQTMANLRRS